MPTSRGTLSLFWQKGLFRLVGHSASASPLGDYDNILWLSDSSLNQCTTEHTSSTSVCQCAWPSFPLTAAGRDTLCQHGGVAATFLSVTARRAARRCAPVAPGTPGWRSCLRGPPAIRRGDPNSSTQSLRCCRCHLDKRDESRVSS